MSYSPLSDAGDNDDRRGRNDRELDDIEKYNQPIELEHVDLSDTTGLLDEEEIDDDNHPIIDARRRSVGGSLNPNRSVRISQGILILFIIFFIGAMILVSYRVMFKPITPTPAPPVPSNTFKQTAYIIQSWPASLCSNSTQAPCDRVRNFTEFVMTNFTAVDEQCGGDTAQFDEKRDVSESLLNVWAASIDPGTHWSAVGCCLPTGIDKEGKKKFVAKEYFDSLYEIIDELEWRKTLEERLKVKLVADTQGTTVKITTTHLTENLQVAQSRSSFFECIPGEVPVVTSITTCLQATLKQIAGTETKTEDWAPASCPKDFYDEGIRIQDITCGTGDVVFNVQKS